MVVTGLTSNTLLKLYALLQSCENYKCRSTLDSKSKVNGLTEKFYQFFSRSNNDGNGDTEDGSGRTVHEKQEEERERSHAERKARATRSASGCGLMLRNGTALATTAAATQQRGFMTGMTP